MVHQPNATVQNSVALGKDSVAGGNIFGGTAHEAAFQNDNGVSENKQFKAGLANNSLGAVSVGKGVLNVKFKMLVRAVLLQTLLMQLTVHSFIPY